MGAADATGEVVDVVVDPPWGPVLAGGAVDVVEPPDAGEVVVEPGPEPEPEPELEPEPETEPEVDADLPEWTLGRVVVVVVVVEPVVADAAPSTC